MTAQTTRGVLRGVKLLSFCVGVLVLAGLAGSVESAQACSCAFTDSWAALRQSDAAFVGRLVSRRNTGDGLAVLTFSVERAIKGAIGDTVDVQTWRHGSSCGIEASVGDRVGLFLDRAGGTWTGNLCRQVQPEEMLVLTSLPAPKGRGAPAMYIGGRFGPARTLALDAKGRTLAYGMGAGKTTLLSVCPGRQFLAEVAPVRTDDRQRTTYEIAIRETRSLRMVRRQRLKLPGWRFATGLLCEGASGASVVVFGSWAGDAPNRAALYRVGPGRVRPIWQGTAFLAHLHSARAYLRAGRSADRMVSVDLDTGRVEPIARLELSPSLVPNRWSTRLAGLAWRLDQRSRIFLVDVRTRPPKVRSVALAASEVFGEVLWLSGQRLVFVPSAGRETTRVLDLSLRTLRRFPFTASDAILRGPFLFGVRGASLVSVALPRGTSGSKRDLPGRAEVIVSAAG